MAVPKKRKPVSTISDNLVDSVFDNAIENHIGLTLMLSTMLSKVMQQNNKSKKIKPVNDKLK
ncbi:MAG: hypothetical protein GY718_13200 [Lentisphaerae bacterium]|nr:hypothetical protein [Lentisphaerota bacterium]